MDPTYVKILSEYSDQPYANKFNNFYEGPCPSITQTSKAYSEEMDNLTSILFIKEIHFS